MQIIEKITRNKYLRAIIRYMYLMSAWYMRRRAVTKALLFFSLFILPILIHSYIASQPFISKISDFQSVIQYVFEEQQKINYTTIQCTNLFPRKLYVAGPFSYTTCYIINDTHVLFNTGSFYGVIVFLNKNATGDSYGVSYVVDDDVSGVKTRYLMLVAIADSEDVAVDLLREAIEKKGLGSKTCEVFLPGTSFNGWYIPYRLYDYFCQRR